MLLTVSRFLFVLPLAILALVSCEPETPSMDPAELVEERLSRGQFDEAINELRVAIRNNPDDGELRALMARVYLEQGKGALAEETIEQAIKLGVSRESQLMPLARALFSQSKFRDLMALDDPDSSHPFALELRYLKTTAHARLAVGNDAENKAVVADYIGLFQTIDSARNANAAALMAQLNQDRLTDDVVGRALAHFECRSAVAEPVKWSPLQVEEGRRVVRVGPSRKVKTVAEAARLAKDGDLVEIDPGVYRGDVATWVQSDIVVRGAGERPHITAAGRSVEGRDVWLFEGDNVVVENVEVSGAKTSEGNGAAIRHLGNGLRLRHVFLHDSQNGLLTGNRYPDTNTVLIEFSEFAENGDGRGLAHNMYIGRSNRFEIRFSVTTGAKGGHQIKTRAKESLIAYNRIADTPEGRSSYLIDVPSGGVATVLGNQLLHGSDPLNHAMISFGGESLYPEENSLTVSSNSVFNRAFKGIGIRNHQSQRVSVVNNVFGGAPFRIVDGPSSESGNIGTANHGMADPRNWRFELVANALAVDAALPGQLTPEFEYVHPVSGQIRTAIWLPDAGAHERCGP